MKKFIFLLIAISAMVVSCKKETPKNPHEQTLIVEVYFLDSNGVETIPTGSSVVFFEDAEFELHIYSLLSMRNSLSMTLTNGTEVGYKFSCPPFGQPMVSNRHIFENVPDGEYFITIGCFVQGKSPGYTLSYRRIVIDENIHEVVQRIIFTDNHRALQRDLYGAEILFLEI